MEMKFVYNSDQVAMYRVKTLRGFDRFFAQGWQVKWGFELSGNSE